MNFKDTELNEKINQMGLPAWNSSGSQRQDWFLSQVFEVGKLDEWMTFRLVNLFKSFSSFHLNPFSAFENCIQFYTFQERTKGEPIGSGLEVEWSANFVEQLGNKKAMNVNIRKIKQDNKNNKQTTSRLLSDQITQVLWKPFSFQNSRKELKENLGPIASRKKKTAV